MVSHQKLKVHGKGLERAEGSAVKGASFVWKPPGVDSTSSR
jgi:hypothetical protein